MFTREAKKYIPKMLLDTHIEHLLQTTEKSILPENPPSPLKERKYVRKEGKGREKGEDHGGVGRGEGNP